MAEPTHDEMMETMLRLAGWRDDCGCGDLFLVDEFADDLRFGTFTDYDGYGYPARVVGTKVFTWEDSNPFSNEVRPSTFKKENLPNGTTHILWFNR